MSVVYPEKTISKNDTYLPMVTVTLCTIAKTWKQLMSINRGMDKEDVVHIYILECHSAIKRNNTRSFLEMYMDPESVIQSEVNQKEKIKHHILTHIGGI